MHKTRHELRPTRSKLNIIPRLAMLYFVSDSRGLCCLGEGGAEYQRRLSTARHVFLCADDTCSLDTRCIAWTSKRWPSGPIPRLERPGTCCTKPLPDYPAVHLPAPGLFRIQIRLCLQSIHSIRNPSPAHYSSNRPPNPTSAAHSWARRPLPSWDSYLPRTRASRRAVQQSAARRRPP